MAPAQGLDRPLRRRHQVRAHRAELDALHDLLRQLEIGGRHGAQERGAVGDGDDLGRRVGRQVGQHRERAVLGAVEAGLGAFARSHAQGDVEDEHGVDGVAGLPGMPVGRGGPGEREGQEEQQGRADGQEEQLLEAEPPAGLLDAGEQELHRRPGHGAVAALIEEVEDDRNARGGEPGQHPGSDETH